MSQDELFGLFQSMTVSEAVWDAAGEEADSIIKNAKLSEGARVLVIPRGTGQYAVALAARGMSVTAAGPDDIALVLARERAEEEGVEIDFVVGDPTNYTPQGEFDLVVNLSSSFDFVKGAEEGGVFASLFKALRPGGYAVLRMVNLDTEQRRVDVKDWREGPQGLLVLEELERDWDIGWVSYRWLIVAQGGERFEFHLGHRGYDAEWILETLTEVGFSEVELFGSLDQEPFESDTPVVIYAQV